MKGKIELASHSSCTGCSACADICPTQSISMATLETLHYYPSINSDTCISCGKCIRTCPILTPSKIEQRNQKYYAAWSLDEQSRKEGTSGGVGTELALDAIKKGWAVVGAAFDSNWNLIHGVAKTTNEIKKFQGSKYLQSNSENCYKEVLNLISLNQRVLFIGTPCQVDAVKKIIPFSKHELLLTCGIICHGVNSPLIWKDYVGYLENKYQSKLVSYNFRSKSKGWGQDKKGNVRLNVSYQFSNGKVVDEVAWKNQFHYWFGKHLMMRESCFYCPFRKEQRNSDITIGDFWGVERILPNLQNNKAGVSVIVTSSARGDEFLSQCSLVEKNMVDPKSTLQVLKGYIDTRSQHIKDEEIERMKCFSNDYINSGFNALIKKYPSPSSFGRIVESLKFRLGLK